MAIQRDDITKLMRNVRNLGHQKTARTQLGDGIPDNKLGNDGDFRLHMTNFGLKLYAKYNGKWYSFSPDTDVDNILPVNANGALVDNGSITLPNGLIMQWGKTTTSADPTGISFPMEFPNKCSAVYVTGQDDSHSGGMTEMSVVEGTPTTTSFNVSTYTSMDAIYWLAIGS